MEQKWSFLCGGFKSYQILCLTKRIYQCTKAWAYWRHSAKSCPIASLNDDLHRCLSSFRTPSAWNSLKLIHLPHFKQFKASVSSISKALSSCQSFSSLYFHQPALLHFIFRYPELAEKFGSTVLELWLTRAGEWTMVRSRFLLLINNLSFLIWKFFFPHHSSSHWFYCKRLFISLFILF